MTRIGIINCVLDVACFVLIMICMPTWAYWFAKRLIIVFILMQFLAGRYMGNSLLFWDELKRILFSHIWFYIISFVIAYQYTFEQLRDLFFIVCISIFVDMCIARYTRIWFRKFIKKKVLVVGIGEMANSLIHTIAINRFSTMEVEAAVSVNRQLYKKEEQAVSVNVIDIEQMNDFIKKNDIDTVIFAVPEITNSHLRKLMHEVSGEVRQVKFLPTINHSVNFDTKIDDFDGMILVSTASQRSITFLESVFKRFIDILGGITGVILLAPLTLFVYILNRKQGDTGPVFFKQERVGKDGKLFSIYKYRTMVMNAEEKLEQMMKENPAIREEYETNKKLENDPRITKAGKLLRETSLDEFPQLINVLFGTMSLIGPRPYLPREKVDMGNYYETIILTKPGITGMWQTHGRSDVSFEERLELDDYYAHNWSLWLDITLLVRTFRLVMAKAGAK